jgi:hypothetical protein
LLEKLGAKWNWFGGRFDAPSEATLRPVLGRIDAARLDRLVGAWLAERARRDADRLLVIAVDGKVLARGSWTDANDKFTLFSAMVHGPAVTTAQVKVPDGTNEITQVKQLLDNVTDEHHGAGRRRTAWQPACWSAGAFRSSTDAGPGARRIAWMRTCPFLRDVGEEVDSCSSDGAE